MNTGLLLLLVFAPCCLSVQGWEGLRALDSPAVCQQQTCATKGQSCGDSTVRCVDGTYCNGTAFNATCVEYLPVGAPCNEASMCINFMCVSGKCGPDDYQSRLPGAPCTSDYQCFFRNSTVGGQGTCVNGACYGLKLGSSCDVPFDHPRECIMGYCSASSVCVPFIPAGGRCMQNISDSCEGVLLCYPMSESDKDNNIGICALTPLQVKNGDNCSLLGACLENSYCGTDMICRPMSDVTYAPCNDTQPCSNGLLCACDYTTGANWCTAGRQVVLSGSTSVLQNLQGCLDRNNCSVVFCGNDTCADEYCAYMSLLIDTQEASYPAAKCFQDATRKNYLAQNAACSSPDSPTSMWVYIGIGVAAVVVIVAGFGIYMWHRNRGGYDSV